MEPERKIEKLLRAFAKKRREQAGDAVELREEARERLHREIARRGQRTSSGGFLSSLFGAFRPRLAFAVCFVAIIAISGWWLLPTFTRPKPESLASVNREAVNAPLAEQQPAPPPAPSPSIVLPSVPPAEAARDRQEKPMTFGGSAPQQTQPTIRAGNSGAIIGLDKTPAPAVASENGAANTSLLADIDAAATAAPSRGPLAQKTAGAPVDSFASGGLLSKDSLNRAATSAAASINTNATMGVLSLAAAEPEAEKKLKLDAPSSTAPAGSIAFDNIAKNETAKANALASQHFYRTDVAVRRSPKESTSGSAPVLTSFRVEQNNANEMQIVDADGSIYTGTVQAANEAAMSRAALPAAFKNAAAAPANNALQQTSTAQNYFFRVAGTNRNLRENVVFSGNLIPLTNIVWTNASAVGGGEGAMPTALPDSLLSNSRISGKAVIGNQREIDVNATPAR